jgi:hypothetical protein
MAMGIVSDTDFETEQENLSKPVSKSVPIIQPQIVDMNRGRGNGNVNVPNGLRKIIGSTAIEDGRKEAVELGRNFGLSPSSVSAYTQGATSTASYDEQPNKSTITSAKERIARSARSKLRQALTALTPDKLQDTKAVDLSTIAKNMAGVVKQMEPDISNQGMNGNGSPTFILYAPQFRKEENFEVVYAKE